MKRILLTLICLYLSINTVYAAASTTNQELKAAIIKFKNGNYIGCMQDMQDITYKDPSNALAYYYLAISYVKVGDLQGATDAYNSVISLSTSPQLKAYAKEGLKKLNPEPVVDSQTNTSLPGVPATADVASKNAQPQTIGQPPSQQLPQTQIPAAATAAVNAVAGAVSGSTTSGTVTKDIDLFMQQQRLNQIKDVLNQNKKLDPSILERTNTYGKKTDNSVLIDELIAENTSTKQETNAPVSTKTETEKLVHQSKTEVNQVASKPSADDVVKAMQVLKNAGFEYTKPQAQVQTASKPDSKMMEMMLMMSQMGTANQFSGGGTNNNQMTSMMPLLMMSQGDDALKKMDPKVLQVMMSGMMSPDLSMFSGSDKNNY